VLGRETVRVVLAPGDGLADGGIHCDLPLDLVPAVLRTPGTKLWVELDGSGNVTSARPRADPPEP
jgi:hypothetical protein